jgi:hypothetical protein
MEDSMEDTMGMGIMGIMGIISTMGTKRAEVEVEVTVGRNIKTRIIHMTSRTKTPTIPMVSKIKTRTILMVSKTRVSNQIWILSSR